MENRALILVLGLITCCMIFFLFVGFRLYDIDNKSNQILTEMRYTNEILSSFRKNFEKALQSKTGWGKNEVLDLFNKTLAETLADKLSTQESISDVAFKEVEIAAQANKNTIVSDEDNDGVKHTDKPGESGSSSSADDLPF